MTSLEVWSDPRKSYSHMQLLPNRRDVSVQFGALSILPVHTDNAQAVGAVGIEVRQWEEGEEGQFSTSFLSDSQRGFCRLMWQLSPEVHRMVTCPLCPPEEQTAVALGCECNCFEEP